MAGSIPPTTQWLVQQTHTETEFVPCSLQSRGSPVQRLQCSGPLQGLVIGDTQVRENAHLFCLDCQHMTICPRYSHLPQPNRGRQLAYQIHVVWINITLEGTEDRNSEVTSLCTAAHSKSTHTDHKHTALGYITTIPPGPLHCAWPSHLEP